MYLMLWMLVGLCILVWSSGLVESGEGVWLWWEIVCCEVCEIYIWLFYWLLFFVVVGLLEEECILLVV